MIALFHWFVKITGWLPQKLVFRTKVYYEDEAVQGRKIKGKAIVAPNHTSLFDYAVMMFLFPMRTLRGLVAEVMYNKGFLMRLFFACLGTIRVDRTTNDFSFIDKSRRVLERGGVIEIYPEARLPDPGDERPLPFKPSTVYLALETDTPIIPVFSTGKLFCKERNRVIIGTPFYVQDMIDESLSTTENVQIITQRLRGKIIELEQQLAEKAEKDR